ncbi:Gamma-glutamyl-putrescine synthetase [Klebsiella pneumoniae]|nr:Gamma-glutamyl-putrescine synthetase [Klebsiella pneumoniae]
METNIVEVENFVQHTDERRGSAFTQEVKRYLEKYPDTQFIDVLLTDLNGCFRGKRIPVAGLSKLEKGCYFPASVFAMDILGNVVEEAGLGQELGEPDCICVPVPGTLTPSAADPEYIGQVQLTMVDEDGAPFDVEPRNVLNRLWQQLRQRGLFPV